MELCSYFRLRDGQAFAEVRAEMDREAASAGYLSYQPLAIPLNPQTTIQAVGYYHLTFPREPLWLNVLGAITGQNHVTGLPGRGHSAAMLIDYGGHLYVLTFGTAYTIPKRLSIERRFGKTVVGNGKYQDEVRAIKAKVHGVAGKVRHERRGRGGPLLELEMPRRANMASGIAAKLQLGTVEHVASGDSSIKTVAPNSVADLAQKLAQLEVWWNGGAESDAALAELDRVIDVQSQQLISQLDNLRLTDIRANNSTKFSLCLDDDELWEATQVEYIVNRQRLSIGAFDEAGIFAALNAIPAGIDPLRVRYEAVVPTRATPVNGRLAENLAFETQLPGQSDTFIYEDGGWFQARAQWKQQVTQDVQTLLAQTPRLLGGINLIRAASSREQEGTYIGRQMASAPLNARCLMMHLNFRPNARRIELCDICIDGKFLFFMKRGSDRSACGDVTQQALDSANALVDADPAFLNWANTQLAPKGWRLNINNRSQIVFCIALLTGKQLRLPTSYSVRSMDALSMHLREIEKLGFRAAMVVL